MFRNNIQILNELMQEHNIYLSQNPEHLEASINDATNRLIPLWTDDSICLRSLAHKAQYIHDLLYLKACYDDIKEK